MNSGIYKITCTTNGKFYIGSSFNINRRLDDHFRRLKRNKHNNVHLQNTYNRYGEESFIREIVEYCPHENIVEREQHYLDTLKPPLNISPTAYSNLCVKHGAEFSAKVSRQFKGKPKSPESIRKGSETRIRMGLKRKKVCCIDLITGEIIKIYDGLNNAAKEVDVHHGRLSNICLQRLEPSSNGSLHARQVAAGYTWRYLEDYDKETVLKQLKNVQEKLKPVKKLHPETREILATFTSYRAAEKSVKVRSCTISKACKTGEMVKGFYWEK